MLGVIVAARLAGVARRDKSPKSAVLSNREAEMLTWAARGKTSLEIAQIVGLTKRTLDFHIENTRIKLGVTTRIEAAIRAMTWHMIEP
jgi:DNA-binding CsgD family transcriptional regulator